MLFTSFAKVPSVLLIIEEETINNFHISYTINGTIDVDAGTPSLNNE